MVKKGWPMAEMMMGKFLRGAVNFKLGPNLLSLNFEPFPWTTDLVFTRKVLHLTHRYDYTFDIIIA